MNYIHFSPHFPSNYCAFSAALKKNGVNVLGIGDAHWDQLSHNLKESLSEYYRVDDLHNNHQLLDAADYFINRYSKIDGIDSHNEYWLEREAMLRDKFDIAGLKPEQLATIRSKSEMKKIFRKASLRVAAGKVVQNINEARELIQETGFPVVGKPDKGVGAADTYKICNDEELEGFFSSKPPIDYIMEAFVDGDIISFDGLVGKDGELLFFTAMQNEKGVMEVVHQDSHVYYYTHRDVPADLEAAGRKALKAFDVKGRFFHFEFFREHKTGELVALEVNMRPPGGFSTDMFNYSCDIDVYQAWADMISGKKNGFTFERKYHVCFVSRKSRFAYALSHEEVMNRFGGNIVFSSGIDGALAKAMGDFCYLVRSENLDEMFEIQKAIHQMG
ncbi:MAG: ATP-grasp domain-containing protein [Bacteroidales bacterium]|nr:ATP-grasp domain-containing protein [Bacteroidales bacterium]